MIDVTPVADTATISSPQEYDQSTLFSSSKVSGWSMTGTHWNSSGSHTLNSGATATRTINVSDTDVDYQLTMDLKGSFRVEWNGEVIGTISVPDFPTQTRSINLPAVNADSAELKLVATSQVTLVSSSLMDLPDVDMYEDTSLPLDITAVLTDTDGSETLSTSVAGIPDQFVLSDGTNSATSSGVGADIDISSWDLGKLTVTPTAGSVTDFNLTVTATTTENASGDQATDTLEIHVDMLDIADSLKELPLMIR